MREQHYLTTWFPIDVVSGIPFGMLKQPQLSQLSVLKILKATRAFKAAKLVRLIKFSKLIKTAKFFDPKREDELTDRFTSFCPLTLPLIVFT